jgi:hypothetical protein
MPERYRRPVGELGSDLTGSLGEDRPLFALKADFGKTNESR